MNCKLPPWTAIELVCKIICRYEFKVFVEDDYRNTLYLKAFLDNYISKEFSLAVAEKVFGPAQKITRYTSTTRQSRAFQDVITDVRLDREVEISKVILKKFKDYIKEPKFGEGLIIETKNKLVINAERSQLQGNFYEVFYHYVDPYDGFECVVNCILEFQFSSVKMTCYDPTDEVFFVRKGIYDIHIVQEGYVLQLNFLFGHAPDDEKPKYVSLTIPFGKRSDFTAAFGALYQTNPYFSCLNAIIYKTHKRILEKELIVRHTTLRKKDFGSVPSGIWDFLMAYRSSFVGSMPFFESSGKLEQFIDDMVEEFRERHFKIEEVYDVDRALYEFKKKLEKVFMSGTTKTVQDLVKHLDAISEGISLYCAVKGKNPLSDEEGESIRWFWKYYKEALKRRSVES